MTSEAFKKANEILSGTDIHSFATKMCEKYKIDPVKDFPPTTRTEIIKSAARRRLLIGSACNLMKRAIFLGATSLEILRIAEYYLVAFYTIEKSLDYKACKEALKILELEQKYSREVFLSLDVDENELQQIIDRDNDYYGVKIK